jgi:hypothetical protein
MRTRIATGVAISLAWAMGTAASAQENPFDAVFAIMTLDRAPDSPGCRGCHVGPKPAIEPYFGDTQDEVETTLITFGDGEIIAGGRNSIIANFLRDGVMPDFGAQWTDDQLELLYLWLDQVAPSCSQ